MKAFDFEACTHDAEVYCNECLPDGVDTESDEAHPVFADSEWDYYPVCRQCGTVHNYVSLISNPETSTHDHDN